MTKLVTIYGGSGFVGKYIARRMAKEGWRVRVAVRRPNEAIHVKPYGTVGQVEPVLCNVRDDASVRAAAQGANAVINCVGVLTQRGKNTFEAVQAEGAGRIARIAKEEGVGQLVHISAIGADADAEAQYSQTKAEGEANVLAAFPSAIILRPSIIFGTEDEFFNRFGKMASSLPILPVFGGDTKFQPIYVDDVAQAAVVAATGGAKKGVYELGGQEVFTFKELMQQMLSVLNRDRMILNLPFWVGKVMAFKFSALQFLTAGLFHNDVLTSDQVESLKVDNVVAKKAKTLSTLGITPTPLEVILPDYLWVYRKNGQFDDIQNSAKNFDNI